MRKVVPPSSSEIIKKAIKGKSFQKLIERGCDQAELVGILTALKWAVGRETWNNLTGMKPKRLRDVVVKNLRENAEEIRQLNKNLGFFLGNMRYPREYRTLPGFLAAYAKDLEELSRTGVDQKQPLFNDLKIKLVRYIKETTGHFCDAEVSALLSEILDKPSYADHPYDATNHQAWRRKFYKK